MRRHGWLTAEGRAARQRIEALADDLAAPPHDGLEPGELDQLITGLEPLAAALQLAGLELVFTGV